MVQRNNRELEPTFKYQNFELWYLEPRFNIKMIVKNQACLDNVIVLEIINHNFKHFYFLITLLV